MIQVVMQAGSSKLDHPSWQCRANRSGAYRVRHRDDGATRAPQRGRLAAMAITTLKRRPEFLRVRGGGRASLPAFVIEGKARVPAAGPAVGEAMATLPTQAGVRGGTTAAVDQKSSPIGSGDSGTGPRFGFTVTKKIGNAVVRNRIRRRLKAALARLAPDRTRADFDYVIIAREGLFDRPFTTLIEDLASALNRVHAGGGKGAGRARGPAQRRGESGSTTR